MGCIFRYRFTYRYSFVLRASPSTTTSPSPSSPASELLQSLQNPAFQLSPQPHNLQVSERQDLACNNPAHAFGAITPPEEIGQAGPPARSFAVDHRVLQVQEESEAPALWWVGGFGVQLGEGVSEVGARGGDALD